MWDASLLLGVPVTSIVDFSASVNPLGTSSLAAAAISRAVRFLPFYPDDGCSQLKQAIALYVEGISSDNILVGNGNSIFRCVKITASLGTT